MSNVEFSECLSCHGNGWILEKNYQWMPCNICFGLGEIAFLKIENKKNMEKKPRIIDSLKEFKSFIDAVKYGKFRYVSCGIKGEE